MDGKTLRWGICSAGRICHDFTNSLVSLPKDEHKVKAVAASALERAEAFANEFGIPHAYGTYQELANDVEVDVVYIGSINTKHFEQSKMMLEAGKAVLCEKPCCTTVEDAKELVDLAKKKNLFFMEGLWSRFFPVYRAAEKAIAEGAIGDVQMLQAEFGVCLPQDPNHRVVSKELGGGALYDLGIYLLQIVNFVFKKRPIKVKATGFLNPQGVDYMVGMMMKYSENQLASLTCSAVSKFPNEAVICGTKGSIKIGSPFWCPTTLTINGTLTEHPVPPAARPMIFDNSEGFAYEAQEVRRCLLEKLTESPVVPHATTIELAEITAEVLKDIGYGNPP